jgi:outer membrane scaffolding protein for murein synthesis (MipA/OmpV family)
VKVSFWSSLCVFISIYAPSLYAADSDASGKWEFGVGLGGLSIPHYRGSDQRDEYIAPVPYVKFKGNRLKVDREGGRYYFYNGEQLKIDLSAAFAFPVDSNENTARQGMPDLDAILEVGPRFQWHLWESQDHRLRLRFAAPIRAAINLSDAGNEGWFFAPYFQIRYYSTMETAFSIGPMWASEKFHDYYYQVDSAYATAGRPAYDAKAGYSGFRLTLTNSHRISKHYWWGGFMRYDSLSGAEFVDSPLVKKKDALFIGFAISYVINPVKEYYTDPLND